MLLYTDGITEAWSQYSIEGQRDASYDMFGESKLQTILQQNGDKKLEDIKNCIINELKDFKIEDDMTLFLMRKK